MPANCSVRTIIGQRKDIGMTGRRKHDRPEAGNEWKSHRKKDGELYGQFDVCY
jgi:hypothetical protein